MVGLSRIHLIFVSLQPAMPGKSSLTRVSPARTDGNLFVAVTSCLFLAAARCVRSAERTRRPRGIRPKSSSATVAMPWSEADDSRSCCSPWGFVVASCSQVDAVESQRIGHHRYRAEAHRGGGDDGRQQQAEKR